MTDNFQQDPEELPDWLKELRSRGSIEDDADPIENPAPEDEQFSAETHSPLEDQDSVIEAQDAVPPSEADSPPAEEPNWLSEIRRRHQQSQPESEAMPEQESDPIPDEASIPAIPPNEEITESDDENDPDLARWEAPPILEVPVEPQSSSSEEAVNSELTSDNEGQEAEVIHTEDSLSQENDALAEELNNAESGIERSEESNLEDGGYADLQAWLGNDISEESDPIQEQAPPSSDTAHDKNELENDEAQTPVIDGIEDIAGRGSENPPSDKLEPETDFPLPSLESELNDIEDISFDAADDNQGEDSEVAAEQKSPEDFEELMSWLSDETQKDEQSSGPRPFSTLSEDDLEPADLPDWLQDLKPGAQPQQEEHTDLESGGADALYESYYPDDGNRDNGPLDGLSGILPAEPEIAQYGQAKLPTGELNINKGQLNHAANFEAVLEKEGAPLDDHNKRIALPLRALRLLFAGLIMLAVLFPLISGTQTASRPPLGSLPESTAFYNQIDLLPPNVPVLVAFEVQPALYGEMKPLMSTVINHLLDKQARLVFISTQPTGPSLAEKLLREELSHQPSVTAGDYVNLGYLSGGSAALRYFAASPRDATLLPQLWDTPILQSINTISNFGIVLVVTGDADDGRAWIEQVSPLTSDGLFALASAQAGPLLDPYLDSDPVTVRSLVSGLSGAGYYESLRNRDGLAREYWDAYSYGLGTIAMLILFGGLYSRLIQMRPERKAPVQEKDGDDAS